MGEALQAQTNCTKTLQLSSLYLKYQSPEDTGRSGWVLLLHCLTVYKRVTRHHGNKSIMINMMADLIKGKLDTLKPGPSAVKSNVCYVSAVRLNVCPGQPQISLKTCSDVSPFNLAALNNYCYCVFHALWKASCCRFLIGALHCIWEGN